MGTSGSRLRLTESEAVIPPAVGALAELEAVPVLDDVALKNFGTKPTIASYNASAVKMYDATSR
jgi:hypothetical protein